MVALGLIACALFAFALLSRRVEGTFVTGPMVFVAAGLICGGTGLIDLGAALQEVDERADGAIGVGQIDLQPFHQR